MPLINAGAGAGLPAFYTTFQVTQLFAMGIANLRFGCLVGAPSQNLVTHQASGVQPIGPVPQITRSIGLITCASVIYVLGANYYVHHANAGVESAAAFGLAIAALGAPPLGGVTVFYAHNNAQDAGYIASVAAIAGYGIPAGNIYEIENLAMSQFGINNEGRLGY